MQEMNHTLKQQVDEIFEALDDNLANAPGQATEIGWEVWGEEKREYYVKTIQALATVLLQRLPKEIDNHKYCDATNHPNPSCTKELGIEIGHKRAIQEVKRLLKELL
jgi:hypothetical protein